MAIQFILDTLDGIPDVLKAEYKKDDATGKFTLDLVGGEDTTALKNAKEHEKNLRVAAENRVRELTDQLTTAQGNVTAAEQARDAAIADKGKDVTAIEASWQQKVDEAKAAKTKVETELTGEIERLLVTNTAQGVAAEISVVPELFETVVAKRLKVEKGADGKYFTRVLDDAGQPSAKTVDELKQELLANEKYSRIVVSGKGSGGGAGGSGSGGGADKSKKWLDYNDAELSELRKTNRPEYDRLKAEHTAPAA